MSSRFALGALCIIGTVILWSGWYVVIRLGLTSSSLDVQDLATLRFGVAGFLLLPVLWKRGLALDRLGWQGLVAIALGGGAPFALLVGAGLVYAPVSHASAITQGMVPLTVGLVAAVVLKERLTAAHLLGFALIVAGALVIAGVTLAALASRESIGHAFFVAAAFIWAGYTVALRKAHLEGLHAPAIAAVASLVLYVPVYLFFRGDRLLAAPVRDLVLQGVCQGVLVAVVSMLLYSRGVALLGATSAGAFVAFGPVAATLLAIVVLGETPRLTDRAGIAIITLGVLLASGTLRNWRAQPT
ncbi:MAG: DMT family transporter [Reyranella sp.]|uniref:DMT family transporter n=1 Tax=Reyranella sp. TaxID=1929291 RepID=UPI001ACB978E|nr:DMT family transporter [Reyranella sp.]MBN9087921.1 DMT family transporter [Reyranella sp.]